MRVGLMLHQTVLNKIEVLVGRRRSSPAITPTWPSALQKVVLKYLYALLGVWKVKNVMFQRNLIIKDLFIQKYGGSLKLR